MFKKSLAILSVSAAFLAQAQDISTIKNTYEVYGSSLPGTSKYNAMAGATGALGGDVSAVNNNPAGIGVAIASDISGTLFVGNNKNSTSLFGSTNDYKISNADIGQIGGIASFEIRKNSAWKFVNIGVNFSSKSIEDYSESQGNNNINFDLANDALSFRRHAYDRVGTVSKMSIGVGGNYDNRIYLGTALNIHSSHLNQSDAAEMIYESDGVGETFYKQNSPYAEDGNGFSASLGVIGKINNQFRVGASIETPTFWRIDRVYNYYDAVNSDNDGEYGESRDLSTPAKATLSAAFVPNKNFAVNVDYSIGLSKPKFKVGDAGLQDEFNDFYSSFGHQSEVKIGAEYRALGFRVRGGYGFATNPFDSYSISTLNANNLAANQSYDNLFAGKRNTVGVGLGYDFKSFYIDAAYNHISSTYSSPFLAGSSDFGSEYYSPNSYFANDASVVSEVKNVQNNLSLTLGWKF